MGKGIGSILPFAAMAAPFMFPALGAGIGAASPGLASAGTGFAGAGLAPAIAAAEFSLPAVTGAGAALSPAAALGILQNPLSPMAGLAVNGMGGMFGNMLGGNLGGLMDNKALNLGLKIAGQGGRQNDAPRPPMLMPLPPRPQGSSAPQPGIVPPGSTTNFHVSPEITAGLYGIDDINPWRVGGPLAPILLRRYQESRPVLGGR